MHLIMPTMRSTLVCAGAIFLATSCEQVDDPIRGAPSEANHFIATPDGWVHPKTPWGEPDIRATLDMMQASRVPLERCADSYRPGAAACDMDKKWLTEDEFEQAMEAYRNQEDRMAQLIE